MKKIIAFVFLSVALAGYSQPAALVSATPAVQQPTPVVQPTQKPAPAVIKKDAIIAQVTCPPFCGSRNTTLGFFESFLCLLPVISFLLLLFILRKKMKDINLADTLKENELSKRTVLNPYFNAESLAVLEGKPQALSLLTPTIEVTGEEQKSSSRLMAFLASCIALLLALCFSTFYIYTFLKTGIAIDLSGLSDILLSLGIGVVPYAFNKVAAAIK